MSENEVVQVFAEITGHTATFRGPDTDAADQLIVSPGVDARTTVLRRTVWEARRLQQSVELVTAGDHGQHRIRVSPDGTIVPSDTGDIDEFTAAALNNPLEEPTPLRPREPRQPPGETAPVGAAAAGGRPSFISDDTTPSPGPLPGMLARLGIPVRHTRAQAQQEENVRATSRHWGGCRVIAVVNGKGGVGKTMTSAMLAAVYARNGGGGVLAWDNNDTRGTLGWRTEASQHDATVQDALTAAPRLLDPTAGAGDIASYVHHQTADRYDVLRSNPQLLAVSQRMGQVEFDQLLHVSSRYYRLVIFDSGNDESAPRWLRMIDSAHQLVVPTLTAPESAESAALLLEALTERDEHSARLARDAVVVLTQAERGSTAQVRRVVDAFTPLVAAVQMIPFDPALKAGPLRFEALRPLTRRAWVAAGAAIAAGLQ